MCLLETKRISNVGINSSRAAIKWNMLLLGKTFSRRRIRKVENYKFLNAVFIEPQETLHSHKVCVTVLPILSEPPCRI